MSEVLDVSGYSTHSMIEFVYEIRDLRKASSSISDNKNIDKDNMHYEAGRAGKEHVYSEGDGELRRVVHQREVTCKKNLEVGKVAKAEVM